MSRESSEQRASCCFYVYLKQCRGNSFLFNNGSSNISGAAANLYQCGRKKNSMNSNEIRGQWNYPLIYFDVRAETGSASIEKMLIKS